MKMTLIPFVLSTVLVAPGPGPAAPPPQTAEDRAGIEAAALDYGDGWYEGDARRMRRALHPELAKRVVLTRPGSGRSRLGQMGAMTLVEYTRAGGGTNAPVEKRPAEVTILDVFEQAAVVRVDGPEWVDYLHMARWNGRWVIVNVLWEPRPEHRDRLNGLMAG